MRYLAGQRARAAQRPRPPAGGGGGGPIPREHGAAQEEAGGGGGRKNEGEEQQQLIEQALGDRQGKKVRPQAPARPDAEGTTAGYDKYARALTQQFFERFAAGRQVRRQGCFTAGAERSRRSRTASTSAWRRFLLRVPRRRSSRAVPSPEQSGADRDDGPERESRHVRGPELHRQGHPGLREQGHYNQRPA